MKVELNGMRGASIVLVLLLLCVYWCSIIVHAADKPHYKASQSTRELIKTTMAKEVISPSVESKLLDNSSVPTQYTLEETDDKQVKVYQYKDENGTTVFTDHAPIANEYQIVLYDCYACRPDPQLDWEKIPLYPKNFDQIIRLAAKNYQLDPALIRAVIHAESDFNALAISKMGAMGLMQLMPDTAKELGVENAFKAEQNINGGVKYLASMLKLFDDDIELACAAYNAGPNIVTHYQGVPPYPETIAYVDRVKILLKRYQNLAATVLVGSLN
ncbi:transglycosylase SLT domain-containing protein [Shewanella sp. VB17]|uniref:transglycosylase SLT domain-containing protein n=1 Tax=Shewanella sp. VB17 TaxID=2739432 RepID=UPI0020B6F99B|nr:transglycosylase SLT domain-containing protein [Shewanella sp. VB17]